MSSSNINAFTIGSDKVEAVNSFTFLGSTIEQHGDCKAEINRRIILARSAMAGLDKIWKDKNLQISTKVRLVQALVFPIALYGCETWTPRKLENSRLDAFEHWCWRRMLRISWTEKRTNVSIKDQIQVSSALSDTVLRHKLSNFGHVVRADGLEKSVMLGMGEGKRERGRPRTRWLDGVTGATGMTLRELVDAAQDRIGWRAEVMKVTRGRLRPDGTR
jgi:hypothetical protein